MQKKLFSAASVLFLSGAAYSQQLAYFDAAQAYNRLLIEKNSGAYQRIDNYKVIGSSYFLGEKRRANLFAKGETAYNISVSYNTYNQQVEFYSSQNPNQPLVKEATQVDSFALQPDAAGGVAERMSFVNGSFIGGDIKSFYRLLQAGPRYSLYKKYKSTLGIVSTNYVQSDLRQFELGSEYYYYDQQTLRLEKLKNNLGAIRKEFKGVKDLTAVVSPEEYTANPDAALKTIFTYLNN